MIRTVLKRFLLVCGIICCLPLILLAWLETAIMGRRYERMFGACKEILSLVPTIIGQYIRLGFYLATCRKVSPDACFMLGSMLSHRDVSVASGVVLGVYTIIGCADIGPNVLFGARVSVISGKYQHGRPAERTSEQTATEQYDLITIGANSWIGQEAVLMANVGENCTIAAGAVLYKDAPDNCTFMGNPARKVNL